MQEMGMVGVRYDRLGCAQLVVAVMSDKQVVQGVELASVEACWVPAFVHECSNSCIGHGPARSWLDCWIWVWCGYYTAVCIAFGRRSSLVGEVSHVGLFGVGLQA